MLTVLSGGTGTPKLLQGLARLLKPWELSVLANTGEDVEVFGLRVSPDLDTILYTLAGIIDEEKWYGIRGDTFACHEMLKLLGETELLRLGDRDRAINLYRTRMLERGKSLSEITRALCQRFGVRAQVLPMSDDRVQTKVKTQAGVMSFHEFWVVRRATDRVTWVTFKGVEEARPAPGVLDAIEDADTILIGPSNPITSIGPMLAIKDIREALTNHREKTLAVSPILDRAPLSGPAGVLMEGLGHEVSPIGVARIYRDVINELVIDREDEHFSKAIKKLGVEPILADIRMPDLKSRIKMARSILDHLGEEGFLEL